jgi:hypothetical protein
MAWVIADGALVVLVVVGLGTWFLMPTLSSFRGPSFERASSDDEAVLRAQTS